MKSLEALERVRRKGLIILEGELEALNIIEKDLEIKEITLIYTIYKRK